MAKLTGSTDVVDFRQWVRTLKLSLEAHHDWKFVDLVAQLICHVKSPITFTTLLTLLRR